MIKFTKLIILWFYVLKTIKQVDFIDKCAILKILPSKNVYDPVAFLLVSNS